MKRKYLTFEEFVRQSESVHGKKFIYDKVDLNNRDDKGRVCIICKECGNEFWQTPSNHLSGQGCSHCRYKHVSETKRMPQEEFIRRSKEVFGEDFWDYSKTVYEGHGKKVCVISHLINKNTGNEFGEFYVIPSNHLKGDMPREMAIAMGKIRKKNAITTEDIIKRFVEKYGDKFDYSKVEYVNMATPVIIGNHAINPLTGEEYGWFKQSPQHHLEGCNKHKVYDQEDMLKMFEKSHGTEYDYSESIFKCMTLPVKIICHKHNSDGTEHGEFWQTPYQHAVEKHGCPMCAGRLRKTTDEFVHKLKMIYSDKLIFDDTVYVNYKTPVIVECLRHGKFKALPLNLLKGSGCRRCKRSIMEAKLARRFDEISVDYILDYGPLWLKFKKQQTLDFYLPKENIVIECQGTQHFRPVRFYCTKATFEINLERDENKRSLLKEHGIPLVYYTEEHTIPSFLRGFHYYKKLDELIDDFINGKLKDIYGSTITTKNQGEKS